MASTAQSCSRSRSAPKPPSVPRSRLISGFEAGAAASVDTEQAKRLAKQFKGVYELKLGITRSILAEGMKSGEFHSKVDIDTSAALLVAILDGIGIEVILNVGVRPTDELKNVLISGILSSLTLEPSDAGAKPKKGRV